MGVIAALIQGHSDTGTGTGNKTEETFFAALVPRGDQRLSPARGVVGDTVDDLVYHQA